MCFKVCVLLHYASAKERSFAQRSRAEDAKPHFDLIELHISRRLCTIEIKTAASTTPYSRPANLFRPALDFYFYAIHLTVSPLNKEKLNEQPLPLHIKALPSPKKPQLLTS